MIPLLPFVAGLVAGGLAVRAWRSEETRAGVRKAQDALLSAAQPGVTTLRSATGDLRRRIAGGTDESGENAPAATPKKPRRKTAAAAKPAAAGTRKRAARAKAAPAAEATPAVKRKPATRKRKPAADTTTDA
jgi:hypothetical protein